MNDRAYEQLAEALDRLPSGFPRTPSNVEIRLLKNIFSPDEASLAANLGRKMEPVDTIAQRAGLEVEITGAVLKDLAKRGLLWFSKGEGGLKFRLAPFVVGIFEEQLHRMDEELSRLVEDYLADGGAAGIMKSDPALQRVMPSQGAVNSEWIMPYDDIRKILMSAKSFSIRDCICRVQRRQLGHTCEFPLNVCLSFSAAKGAPGVTDISREEALAILDRTEEAGLVHNVSNVIDGVGYVCNCCGCCCVALRGINEWGIEKSVAHANYFAEIDPDVCQGCGTCIERCQVNAISEEDDTSVIEKARCIGCGLCVTGCPDEAVQLMLKPESEIIHPPADYAAWEQERLKNRGLLEQ